MKTQWTILLSGSLLIACSPAPRSSGLEALPTPVILETLAPAADANIAEAVDETSPTISEPSAAGVAAGGFGNQPAAQGLPPAAGLPEDPCQLVDSDRAEALFGVPVEGQALGGGSYGCVFMERKDIGSMVPAFFFTVEQGDTARSRLIDSIATMRQKGCSMGGRATSDPSRLPTPTAFPPALAPLLEEPLAGLLEMSMEETAKNCVQADGSGMVRDLQVLDGLGDIAFLSFLSLVGIPLPSVAIVDGEMLYNVHVQHGLSEGMLGDQSSAPPDISSLADLSVGVAEIVMDRPARERVLSLSPWQMPLPELPCQDEGSEPEPPSQAAWKAIDNGLDLDDVRELLGHEGEQITQGERIEWRGDDTRWTLTFVDGQVSKSAEKLVENRGPEGVVNYQGGTDDVSFPVGTSFDAVQSTLGEPWTRQKTETVVWRFAGCAEIQMDFVEGEASGTLKVGSPR